MNLYHSFPVCTLLWMAILSWKEWESQFMNGHFYTVLSKRVSQVKTGLTNDVFGLKCDRCHCALHGFQQHNNHFPLSGSKCLGNIHFLTDSSHFKGKDIFTNLFTRNTGLQQLCNLSHICLHTQHQQNVFSHHWEAVECNLLQKQPVKNILSQNNYLTNQSNANQIFGRKLLWKCCNFVLELLTRLYPLKKSINQ